MILQGKIFKFFKDPRIDFTFKTSFKTEELFDVN